MNKGKENTGKWGWGRRGKGEERRKGIIAFYSGNVTEGPSGMLLRLVLCVTVSCFGLFFLFFGK